MNPQIGVTLIEQHQMLLTVPFDRYATDEMHEKRQKQVTDGQLYEFFPYSYGDAESERPHYDVMIEQTNSILLQKANLYIKDGNIPLDIITTPDGGRIFFRGTLETYGFLFEQDQVYICH